MIWNPLPSLLPNQPALHAPGLVWTLAVRAEVQGEAVDTYFVTGSALDARELFSCSPEVTPRLIAAVLATGGKVQVDSPALEMLDDAREDIASAGAQILSQARRSGSLSEGEALRFEQRLSESLKELLPPTKEDRVWVPGSAAYADVQRAIALNTFDNQNGPWPRAELKRAAGFAELRPIPPGEEMFVAVDELEAMKDRMWRNREELSDADVDMMDALTAHWIRNARATADKVPVVLNDLLKLRGLKPKKGGRGSRGGFEAEQRRQLWWSLLKLQDLWLDIAEKPGSYGRKKVLQSRALLLTDRLGQKRLDGMMDVDAILVMPGEAFARFLLGPGRQVALMSSKALKYDPYRQQPEKRLARYFAWQWRVNASGGVPTLRRKIDTLLQEVGIPLDTGRPARHRERLEKALDRLQSDGVVASWRYGDEFSDDRLPPRGWFGLWREAVILLEAPDHVKDAYRGLAKQKKILPPRPPGMGILVRQRRKELGLIQKEAAEQIGISASYLSIIESGQRVSAKTLHKVQAWLNATSKAN